MRSLAANGPIAAQIFGVLAAFVLIAVAPPAQGTMLLLPLDRSARAQLATLAIANGAHLIQAGPLPSSLIVSGERAKLLAVLGSHNILVVAARAAGCGPPAA